VPRHPERFDIVFYFIARFIKDKNITFSPFYNSIESKLPITYPIDSLVSKDGKQFQTFSRDNARGFNKKELTKIIQAYKCIICHNNWDDKIYTNYKKSKKLFNNKQDTILRVNLINLYYMLFLKLSLHAQ